jgi:hypothetical protein
VCSLTNLCYKLASLRYTNSMTVSSVVLSGTNHVEKFSSDQRGTFKHLRDDG